MAEQDAVQRARAVGEQAEEKLSDLANTGAAQADKLAQQAGEQLEAAQDSAKDMAAGAQDQLQDAHKNARDYVNQATNQAQHLAQDAQVKGQQLYEEGQAKLRDAAGQASKNVDQAAKTAGGSLRGAADSVRSYAPQSGPAAEVTRQFASGLEQSGAYLERQSANGIIPSIVEFVRNHPVPAALAGAGILLLLVLAGRRR